MTTLTNSQSYPGSTAISQSPAVSHTTFRLKDPASAITHFIGMVAAVSAAPFLLERAAQTGYQHDSALRCQYLLPCCHN